MRIFSFTGILMSLILIFLVYIILSKDLSYKSKIFLIIFTFILGITLLMNLDVFQNYDKLINTITNAEKTTRIPRDTVNQNTGNYSISMWIYIKDWNYKYGEKKIILERLNNDQNMNPSIYLDSYENNVIVNFDIKDVSGEDISDKNTSTSDISNNYNESLEWCKENTNYDVSLSNIECKLDTNSNIYKPQNQEIKCTFNSLTKQYEYECMDGTRTKNENNTCNSSEGSNTAMITNIPLQKWVNLTFGFGDNHTDIFVDGKLVVSKSFKGVQYMDQNDNNDFYICPNGGFAGYITKTSYYNYLVSPQKAWDIYKDGFNNVMLGSIMKRYRTAITFYEDSNERAKYYIV